MISLFQRSREHQLPRAELLFRKGRGRVFWLNGVLYFGGSLFLMYNAVDYFVEPHARPASLELFWFFAALTFCVLAGYAYGFFLWRQRERTLGDR